MEQVQGYTPEELEQLHENVALGEAMNKLLNNKQFKKLFMEMYVEDGSKFLVDNMCVAKNREMISEQFLARSWFKKHINDVIANGMASEETLKEIQEEINNGE